MSPSIQIFVNIFHLPRPEKKILRKWLNSLSLTLSHTPVVPHRHSGTLHSEGEKSICRRLHSTQLRTTPPHPLRSPSKKRTLTILSIFWFYFQTTNVLWHLFWIFFDDFCFLVLRWRVWSDVRRWVQESGSILQKSDGSIGRESIEIGRQQREWREGEEREKWALCSRTRSWSLQSSKELSLHLSPLLSSPDHRWLTTVFKCLQVFISLSISSTYHALRRKYWESD